MRRNRLIEHEQKVRQLSVTMMSWVRVQIVHNLKVKGMRKKKDLRRIWVLSANKIRSYRSTICKPSNQIWTQLIIVTDALDAIYKDNPTESTFKESLDGFLLLRSPWPNIIFNKKITPKNWIWSHSRSTDLFQSINTNRTHKNSYILWKLRSLKSYLRMVL